MVFYGHRAQMAPQAQARNGTVLLSQTAPLVNSNSLGLYRKKDVAQRQLQIDSMRDYKSPLSVETSVEYDLPSHIYPPKNAEPILMVNPEYTKKKISKQHSTLVNATFSNFLVAGCSPGHGSSKDYVKVTQNKRSSRSGNTSCNKSCYPGSCNFQNSPVYSKSNGTSSRGRSSQQNSNTKMSSLHSTPEHSVVKNNSSRSKQQKQSYSQVPQHQQRTLQQFQNQPKANALYQLPPPSYGTATAAAYGYRQPAHATTADINPPQVGSVVPSELTVPQVMAAADIVRSRGSPKVRSSRRPHTILQEYHLKRPRSNTVGAGSSLVASTPKNTAAPLQQNYQEIAILKQHIDSSFLQAQQAALRRNQDELEKRLQATTVAATMPYIIEGNIGDTPHQMTATPLTPTELMDQDPYPRSLAASTATSTPTAVLKDASGRLIMYSEHQEAAKHHRSASSVSSRKNIDRNSNYFNNFYDLMNVDINNSNNGTPQHRKSTSLITSTPQSKNNDKYMKNNILWKNYTNLFEETMCSPQTIDLTSPKSPYSSSCNTSLTNTPYNLGVPTPPVSNLTSGSSAHFQTNTSNFITNIYQLSNMNAAPIFNLVY